jgi:hypothetical protein
MLNILKGWRGSVKSRYFVISLRDYYQEGGESSAANIDKPSDDDWALQYFSVSRLQPISEALDDDASGFVTVAEANTFTTSRPLDWRYVFLCGICIGLFTHEMELEKVVGFLGNRYVRAEC